MSRVSLGCSVSSAISISCKRSRHYSRKYLSDLPQKKPLNSKICYPYFPAYGLILFQQTLRGERETQEAQLSRLYTARFAVLAR